MRYTFILILFAVALAFASYSEKSSINGLVIDAKTKKPLTGVMIKLSSGKSNYKALTDRNGYYYIELESGLYEFSASYIVVNDSIIPNFKINGSKRFDIELIKKNHTVSDLTSVITGGSDTDSMAIGDKTTKTAKMYSAKRSSGGTETVDVEVAVHSREMSPSPAVAPEGYEVRGSATSETAIMVDGMKTEKAFVHSFGAVTEPTANAGTLTSGELNDFRKWDMWKDFQDNQFKDFSEAWSFKPRQRFSVQAVTNDNRPAIDFTVKLETSNGDIIWESKTDNTGKAELWSNIFVDSPSPDNKFNVKIEKNGKIYSVKDAKEFHNGLNTIKVNDYCANPKVADIAFVVDATGSMGDEIKYLQAELVDIIGKLKDKQKDLTINLGAAFYRDKDDEYLVKTSDLSSDVNQTINFIKEQNANGGGDFPEAVDAALQTSINEFSWSENATARILFLILDAPPHNDGEVKERLREIIAKASKLGIRVVPVTCSGIDKSTEYLMRSLGLATNGSYVFLTDHSGVGGKHLEPSTDKYDVEKMNALFIRLIEQFTIVPECANNNPLDNINVSDNILNQNETQLDPKADDYTKFSERLKCYPNLCNGILYMDLKGAVEEIYLVDISGKIVQKIDISGIGVSQLDMTYLPTGVYFIKYAVEGRWFITKTILQR